MKFNKEHLVKRIIFYSAFIIFVIQSCAPAYVPNVIQTPLLSNKGEIQAAVQSSKI